MRKPLNLGKKNMPEISGEDSKEGAVNAVGGVQQTEPVTEIPTNNGWDFLNEEIATPTQLNSEFSKATEAKINAEKLGREQTDEPSFIDLIEDTPESKETAATFRNAADSARRKTFAESTGLLSSDKISMFIWEMYAALREWWKPKLAIWAGKFTEAELGAMAEISERFYTEKRTGKSERLILAEFTAHEKNLWKWHNSLTEIKANSTLSDESVKEIANLFAREVVDKWNVPDFAENNSWLVTLLMAEADNGAVDIGALFTSRRMGVNL